jgi:hypothetical protein
MGAYAGEENAGLVAVFNGIYIVTPDHETYVG